MNSPILLLVFNRPDTTERVFEEIRKAKPPRLYIAADGPRNNRPGEKKLCDKVRSVKDKVDWDCEVKTLFRDKNLGCGVAVCEAITWFFQHEEEGIIMEDDIVAHPDFFSYCDELLEKYRFDDRVWTIGGHNLYYSGINRSCSYGFVSIAHIWGWATWRRAWNNFRYDISHLDYRLFKNRLKQAFPDIRERLYWMEIFKQVKFGKKDIWDYQWTIMSIYNKALCAVPYKNLTSNIGFGDDATHTSGGNNKEIGRGTESIMPLIHPAEICHNATDEELIRKDTGMYERLGRFIVKKIYGLLKIR